MHHRLSLIVDLLWAWVVLDLLRLLLIGTLNQRVLRFEATEGIGPRLSVILSPTKRASTEAEGSASSSAGSACE